MTHIDIPNIIDFLNTQTAITDITGSRIFWWTPSDEDEILWIYMTVGIVTEVQASDCEKRDRIEFRMLWDNENTTYKSLKELDNILFDLLQTTQDYNWFEVYKVVNQNLVSWYDPKNRKVLIRDMIFYYVNS